MPTRKLWEPTTLSETSASDVLSTARTFPLEANIRAMFDRIAPDYDRFNSWASLGMHQHWRRVLLQRVPARSHLLDIATGTGGVAFLAMEAGHTVTALDFSERMLELARGKAQGARIRWVRASADHLPFSDRSFECVTSAFALRNLKSILEVALKENYRVLRAGGKVLHLDFGRPQSALARWGHLVHLHFGVPLIGQWVLGSRWPERYLEKTIENFFEPAEITRMFETAGFSEVRCHSLLWGVVHLYEGRKPAC